MIFRELSLLIELKRSTYTKNRFTKHIIMLLQLHIMKSASFEKKDIPSTVSILVKIDFIYVLEKERKCNEK